MNAIWFFVSMAFFLGMAALIFKLFGKSGIYVFVGFSAILANIQVLKGIELFGFSATEGNALYAASFFCTDILSERYGKKSAQMAVKIGIFVNILWILGTQLTLLSIPAEFDFAQEHLKAIFSLMPRVAGASLIAYIVSQNADVFLYHYIWQKSGSTKKFLWLRNNGSTLTSQFLDTAVFVTGAFAFSVEWSVFFSILATTYALKAIVALCDTPFIYLARKITPLCP